MRTLILNILCEGQTEEVFVKEVLRPYLMDREIVVKHRLLLTSRKQNAQGGMLSYQQAKRDLTLWMKEVSRKRNEVHYFTTMFDLYALPDDFPGYAESLNISDVYKKIEKIDDALYGDIRQPRFIPYIQLHEFEALLFCDLDKLKKDYPKSAGNIDKLKSVLPSHHDNPELINSNPNTAPSKRIIKVMEDSGYNYNKPRGASVTKWIGIDNLTAKCQHFKEWIDKLKNIAMEGDVK